MGDLRHEYTERMEIETIRNSVTNAKMFIAYAQRIAAKVRFCRLKAFSNCVCKILGKDREIADVSIGL